MHCNSAGSLCLPEYVEHCDGHLTIEDMTLDIPRIKGLCFDVDGTLADTDDQFVETLERWLRPVEKLPHNVQKLLVGYGNRPGVRASIQLARRIVMTVESPANMLYGLPDYLHLDQPVLAAGEWLRKFTTRHSHQDSFAPSFKIIDGVQEMLQLLHKHYPLSVVSARGERGTMHFLEQYDLTGYFTCIATAQTCRHTKPYPDPILWAAQQMGVGPEQCLMIGDTTVDIRAGRSAGAQTVGVLCGFGSHDELEKCGADDILNSTPEILHFLKIC